MSGTSTQFRMVSASVVALLSAPWAACSGVVNSDPDDRASGGTAGEPDPGDTGPISDPEDRPPENLPADPFSEEWRPVAPCSPILPRKATRLSDRHLGNAIRDLLKLSDTPLLQTTSGSHEDFIPNKAAALSGAVFVKLQTLVESAAQQSAEGELGRCTGDENACAGAFIDRFVGRAFRHPLSSDEKTRLRAVYDAGKTGYGGHKGGIRLVIEAALQSPSFLYLQELGTAGADGIFKLSDFDLAAKIALFLLDSVPDEPLWDAAIAGRLATADGLRAEVERLFATDAAKRNRSKMFARLFQMDRINTITKDVAIKEFTPVLKAAMTGEATRFLDHVLNSQGGTLDSLLTSRTAFVDAESARLYGVPHPGGSSVVQAALPEGKRAGILTRLLPMTIEARPEDSSVVHRGVFTLRELLCFHPPAPANDDLTQGAAITRAEPTERARAEKRATISRCAGCHGFFDPFGINFEHYDTLGRYRDSIPTAAGPVAVDASKESSMFDVRGTIRDGVELSQRLAESGAVKECMARQIASYAFGQRVTDEYACAVGSVAKEFADGGGDLLALVKSIAVWPGLRNRHDAALATTEGAQP